MCATTVLSIGAMVTWLILDHELWERPKSSAERARSTLYNIATRKLVQLTSDVSRTGAHRFYERLGFTASHVGFKRGVQAGPDVPSMSSSSVT